jgi:hypothetical protein
MECSITDVKFAEVVRLLVPPISLAGSTVDGGRKDCAKTELGSEMYKNP